MELNNKHLNHASLAALLHQKSTRSSGLDNCPHLIRLLEEFSHAAVEAHLMLRGIRDLCPEKKPDRSDITVADRMIQKMLRERFSVLGFPFVGEEVEDGKSDCGESVVRSGTYIAVDPVDGTTNYINYQQGHKGRGLDHATLIGLVEAGVPRVGVYLNHYTGELASGICTAEAEFETRISLENVLDVVYEASPISSRVEEAGSSVLVMGGRNRDSVNMSLARKWHVVHVGSASGRILALCQPSVTSGLVYQEGGGSPGVWDFAAPAVFARLHGVTILDGEDNPVKFAVSRRVSGRGFRALKGDALGWTSS